MPQSAQISNAVVRVMSEHTGRGPTHARTDITPDVIVVTLRENLNPHERRLVDHGESTTVLAMRRAYQHEMRDDMVASVEKITGRQVEVLMADSATIPDIAVQVFVMRAPGLEPGNRP
jgi:uncharacterized protein YbcI